MFDNPDTALQYQPPPDWENGHRFNPLARWTWREDKAAVRKLDKSIMVWVCVMFAALDIHRNNIKNAVSDDMLDDLDITQADYVCDAPV